ncbi:histidinol-phosphate transaminase [Lysobacter humi (ex Lee et al. 2017)]
MSAPLDLVREDLRDFAGYRSARSERLDGDVWLNANEGAVANLADLSATLRRYPDPQPMRLRTALAELYGCRPEQVLAGRGSDEAIDLLVRALCRPGGDAIVVTSPTFGMYAVSARLNATPVVDVPLRDGVDGFTCDFDAVAEAAIARGAKLVFLCSPANPTGGALPLAAVDALAARLEGRALVVVDEAYQEFADGASAISLLDRRPGIAVLRTLSKAHALAGVRLGSVVADARLIEVLRRCQAPYPLPAPVVAAVLAALSPAARAATVSSVATAVRERARLTAALASVQGIRRVYPSQANFLLVRFSDAQAAFERLLEAGIVVRDMRANPALGDALRISVGRPDENDRVVAALAARVAA